MAQLMMADEGPRARLPTWSPGFIHHTDANSDGVLEKVRESERVLAVARGEGNEGDEMAQPAALSPSTHPSTLPVCSA